MMAGSSGWDPGRLPVSEAESNRIWEKEDLQKRITTKAINLTIDGKNHGFVSTELSKYDASAGGHRELAVYKDKLIELNQQTGPKPGSVRGVQRGVTSRHLPKWVRNTSRILLKTVIDRKKKIINFIFVLLTLFIVFSYKHEVSTVVLRNIQSFIYPGMRVWRKVTVPIIANYPSLTEYYDESCLLTNPYFQVENLNCDPCADVANVLDLTSIEQVAVNYPYIFKTQKELVDINRLQALYEQNRAIFTKDAYKIQSTHTEIRNLDDLFRHFVNASQHVESHSVWRCNRMAPARLLRSIFPRPARLPATGVSLERYLVVDTPQAPPYRIPDAECANMFVIQGYGSRTFLLRPTQECRHRCRTLSVRLPASYGLIYNWWYWKPISLPEQYAKTPSVSYIGSYC